MSPKRELAVRVDGLSAFVYEPDASSTPHIGLADALSTSTALTDLGVGWNPVFAGNGDVLAFAPQGLVEINPKTANRTTLLPVPGGASGAYAPDGSFVILGNPLTGGSDVFLVDPAKPSSMSYLGSLAAAPIALATFPGGFVVETDTASASLYSVSASGMTLVRNLTISK